MKIRTIEVFTAGCALCAETLTLVRDAVAGCGCEVIERRCERDGSCEPARSYGVRAMPSVVIDGGIVYEGRVTPGQAALLKR